MCKVQKVKSTDESGWMGGEAAGVCGVWWELCEEVTEGWGIAIEIVVVGWIFEKEAGCKCRECCVGEESCPSGAKVLECHVFNSMLRCRAPTFIQKTFTKI